MDIKAIIKEEVDKIFQDDKKTPIDLLNQIKQELNNGEVFYHDYDETFRYKGIYKNYKIYIFGRFHQSQYSVSINKERWMWEIVIIDSNVSPKYVYGHTTTMKFEHEVVRKKIETKDFNDILNIIYSV